MKSRKSILVLLAFLISPLFIGQTLRRVPVMQKSTPVAAPVEMTLMHRFQHYNDKNLHKNDVYDEHVHSPKSVNILDAKDKFYVQSLEGCETIVYSLDSFKRIGVIPHTFTKQNASLFKETNYFDYSFRTVEAGKENLFQGKPVESCFSHGGRYLWVTYYRRTYDANAVDPSALCIIDTETDSIVRVMPTAPLPKMIAASADDKYIAVTHWGDNTVGIIDISGADPQQFRYLKNVIIDYRPDLNFGNRAVNRDSECGHCLRGTVFTPDGKYLLVGKMGGAGGIAVIESATQKYLGTLKGKRPNVRHLVINGENLYLSVNRDGYVQKIAYDPWIAGLENENVPVPSWYETPVGAGARTIVLSPDGRYVFAAVNNACKVVCLDAQTMQKVCEIPADAYPVGMDISRDGKYLIVTSQGKENGGGNSVMVYCIDYH
ncbi:MAG: beta-propeller fold lactonase family protein [Bacteroidia bacterium]|nr:beta-propeller fold lactonase family protein [Bacteroidia bacterium]